MQDIVEKVDRAKALIAEAQSVPASSRRGDQIGAEGLALAVDLVGELVANSRRIAVALETIADNTKPVELVTGELVSGPSLTDQLASFDWSNIGFLMGQGFANGDRSAR